MNTDPKHWLSNRLRNLAPEACIHSCVSARCGAGVFLFQRISSISNHPFFYIFSIFLVHFCLSRSGSGPSWPNSMRIHRGSGSEHLEWTEPYSYQIDIKSDTWSVESLLSKSSNVSRVYLFQSRVSTSSGTLNTSLATATILPEAIQNTNF